MEEESKKRIKVVKVLSSEVLYLTQSPFPKDSPGSVSKYLLDSYCTLQPSECRNGEDTLPVFEK